MGPIGLEWKPTESMTHRRMEGLLFLLVLAMVTAFPVTGQESGTTSGIPDFDPVACGCSDIPPPGSLLTCEEQRDFGKCSADWMLVPAPESGFKAAYCQITCGRCKCPGAPEPVEEGPCACSDVPIPADLYSCEEQRDFGKCGRPWMRQSTAALPDGYCQITCGLCPCSNPTIQEIPSASGPDSFQVPKPGLKGEIDSRIDSRPGFEDPAPIAQLEEPTLAVFNRTPGGLAQQPTKLPPPPPPVAGELGIELDEQRLEVENADDYGSLPPPFDRDFNGRGRASQPQRRLLQGLDQFLPRWTPSSADATDISEADEKQVIVEQDSRPQDARAPSTTTSKRSEIPSLPATGSGSFQESSPVPQLPTCTSTIGDLLNSPIGKSQFTIVSQLLVKSGLLQDLNSPSLASTLFVPKDTAFDRLREDIDLDQLLNDDSTSVTNFIRKVFLLHWVDGVISTDQFEDDMELQSQLAKALDNQGTSENQVGILTLKFSEPKDAWFVRSGKRRARVDLSNVDLCGSVVHVVNNVLLPPEDPFTTFIPQGEGSESCGAIVGLFDGPVGGGRFTILLELLKRTELIEEVRNPGLSATIFAPTDEAFRSMPDPFCIDRLLTDTSPRALNEIQKLLLFHVVPRRLERADLTDGLQVGTFLDTFGFENGEGDLVVKNTREFGIQVTGADTKAAIIGPPIDVCKSIVHIIDAVLIPTFNENVVELMLCNPNVSDNEIPLSMTAGPDPLNVVPSPDPNQDTSTTTDTSQGSEPVIEAASETQGPVFGTVNFATITAG